METVRKALDGKNLIVNIFILIWTIFGVIYIPCITWIPTPVENQRTVDTILGFLFATALGGIFNYVIGSSKGSKEAQETIKNVVEKTTKTENG